MIWDSMSMLGSEGSGFELTKDTLDFVHVGNL